MDAIIRRADLSDAAQMRGVADVLDAYAREPAGGSAALPDGVRERLVRDLQHVGNALVFVAVDEAGTTVGAAVCFSAYSTFQAAPLLNIHDLAVLPGYRGHGTGRALLDAVASFARSAGCCKLTLEVLDNNSGARRLYAALGFEDGGPGTHATTTRFLQKPL